jgi:hypothetical protein
MGMNPDTLCKALQKACFDESINQPQIVSDGKTGVILTRDAGNSRIAYIRFPFDLEGTFVLQDVKDPKNGAIKKLRNFESDVTASIKDGKLLIKGKGKSYRFPLINGLCGSTNVSPITPIRRGSTIYFAKADGSEQRATDLGVAIAPEDMSKFKKAFKSEDVYKERATIMICTNGSFNIFGKDEVDFVASDEIKCTVIKNFNLDIQNMFTGLDELAAVLGTKDVTIYTDQDNMFVVEETDGEIEATYAIMPIRNG